VLVFKLCCCDSVQRFFSVLFTWLQGYLHCVRPALCAEWIVCNKEGLPPLSLVELLAGSAMAPEARQYVEGLVARKQAESKLGAGPHHGKLDAWMDGVEEACKLEKKQKKESGESISDASVHHLVLACMEQSFPTKALRIGVLLCTSREDQYGRHEGEMVVDWLSEARTLLTGVSVLLQPAPLHWRAWAGDIPTVASVCAACDLLVVVGSDRGPHVTDQWISSICSLISGVTASPCCLLGLGFGHQLVAHALAVDGTEKVMAPSSNDGEMCTMELTDAGAKFMSSLHLTRSLQLELSAADTVTTLPQGAVELARANLMFALGRNVVSVQGHAEYRSQVAPDDSLLLGSALLAWALPPVGNHN
jgi:GMP synthase-like glutamine amidotransferase